MAIIFYCNQCNKRYEVEESFVGKRAKCKDCGAVTTVPASSSPEPVASTPKRPKSATRPGAGADESLDRFGLDDAPRGAPRDGGAVLLPRRGAGRRGRGSEGSSGVPGWVWLVSGGVGLLLVLLVVGILTTRGSGGRPIAKPTESEAPAETVADQTAPPPETPAPSKPDAGFQRDATSVATPSVAASAQPAWRVKADPAPEKLEFPPLAKLSIPVSEIYGRGDVLFPTTPSPFVALGGNTAQKHVREFWDLRTGTRIGRIPGQIEAAKPMALSPDGAYFVVHTNPVPRTTDIWKVADGTRIARIEDGENIPDYIDFAGPNRVMIGTSYANRLQIWDITTGKVIGKVETPSRFDHDSVALSPGRHYVAMTLDSGQRLQIYSLDNGRLAGELPLQNDGLAGMPGLGHASCEGLAFSSDGTALAGFFSGLGVAHLLCWDVTTGTMESHVRAEGVNPYAQTHAYDGQPVQWLPDQSGWFINDQLIVERKTGQTVWNLPFDKKMGHVEDPRLLLDFDRLVGMVKVRDQKLFQVIKIPREKIVAALSLARGGGSAVDATLPATKTADRNATKKIAASSASANWAFTPPAAVVSKPFSGRSITLKASALDLVSVLFSGRATAQAFVTSSPGARLNMETKSQQGQAARLVERFDLAKGVPLGRFELPSVSSPIAVSPEGGFVLVSQKGSPDRLDVHKSDDGAHVAGWRPYEAGSESEREVVWADFVDAKQVLTVNASGLLILWSLPDCKAVYEADQAVDGVPVLSPDHKSLALLRGGALRLVDPLTGTDQGVGSAPAAKSDDGLRAAAFRADGRELAAVIGGLIVRWDLKTGKIADDSPSPTKTTAALQYAGEGHLLLDNKVLFDLTHKRPVWYFQGGLHATGSPDGGHWYAGGDIGKPAALKRLELPGQDLVRSEATAADPATKAMLRAGSTVSIQVVGSPPRDAEKFRNDAISGLTSRLAAVGVKVADNQPVRLVFNVSEKDLGQTITLQMLGGGPQSGEKRNMAARNVEWTLSVADAQGEAIPLNRNSIGPRVFGIQHIPPGENDWEGVLRTKQWGAALTQALERELPYFVARRPSGSVVLPSWSDLGDPRL